MVNTLPPPPHFITISIYTLTFKNHYLIKLNHFSNSTKQSNFRLIVLLKTNKTKQIPVDLSFKCLIYLPE